MTSEEIKEIINMELQEEPDLTSIRGMDVTQGLITPIIQKYKSSNDSTFVYELWTVFEEREDKNGYKIFFDENKKQFGLAIKSDKDELIEIGIYGTFLDTLYAM